MNSLPSILPVGTAVIALVEVRGPDGRPTHPRGTAGVIVRSPADPEHSYRVRFPGGDEVSLKRRELQVLKHYQREGYDRRVDPLTVLEQLFSPLIVTSTPEHEELRRIAAGFITRHHVHHYLGFVNTQWTLLLKESPPRVKPLLYVYRVLLTGIHLMRTGRVEANLGVLNEEFHLPYIPDLIARKLAGPEQSVLDGADTEFHEREKERLEVELKRASEESSLPEVPTTQRELSDLLVRLRGVPIQ